MFKGMVQKTRHLQAMGYRVGVVWISEWNQLETLEERREYIRKLVGKSNRQNTAFSPDTVNENYV